VDNAATWEITPRRCKGALGYDGYVVVPIQDSEPEKRGKDARVSSSAVNQCSWVYASERLSFRCTTERLLMRVIVANRIGEIPPSGMTKGASENVDYGGNVNPPRNRKGECGNPST
jgi:hypothetical protein